LNGSNNNSDWNIIDLHQAYKHSYPRSMLAHASFVIEMAIAPGNTDNFSQHS
jgi:hypothetical protein